MFNEFSYFIKFKHDYFLPYAFWLDKVKFSPQRNTYLLIHGTFILFDIIRFVNLINNVIRAASNFIKNPGNIFTKDAQKNNLYSKHKKDSQNNGSPAWGVPQLLK